MQKIGTNLYINFSYVSTYNFSNRVRAVIMGNCGNGKTSFINKICNTEHRTGVESSSLTRDIAY